MKHSMYDVFSMSIVLLLVDQEFKILDPESQVELRICLL